MMAGYFNFWAPTSSSQQAAAGTEALQTLTLATVAFVERHEADEQEVRTAVSGCPFRLLECCIPDMLYSSHDPLPAGCCT